MKRILPLILALVAGMAQADSNSDYRAGSDFAHQIKGQGSSSIQGFKPQESIPGYNANPDETKYYGGVTAGGDGGLKNDGTTEWATGETGKTITESFMNKPKDILSPDAPFIQTGRDVVNRADSIVGNTGQQCSAQEISRSEYTNYTCERDLQVEQYCTRTARMELQGSTTWETRTLEYEMSQLPAREVNGQYVVSMTSPVTGEIVDAHYSWSRTYLQKSVPMTITVVQQQGRNGQLRISFGSAKHPDCRGITVDELQKIQFNRLDFTNFYEDLMNNQKIPDSGVLTQKVKEQIADQLKQAGQ
ncbi:TPA: conjugal transfer protein TraN [Escherichia coli]|nr:conjugal transfer protein TraN [Escherichia coli]HCO9170400.1 conjugal transfer protein TraN [Escherichia coli]HCO9179970.1 conjugal transfer protein TraN [Escherichia coli]